ncbi:type IX secretion system outer membrane channel protein PorV [Hymenobacter coccineus]|uniref:Type IX secretion system protein PorV domain-containing protein n=1 Tax=Hymenobacter coccineus TaxID=1908235 RepID=A0A1G1TF72_9BACT|nr:type IX secretion system outer membrane channel protein PorV [Hymenobacter coccineus]OGX89527.1 hypothetical protein BEN49_09020 [Hymenobacter coccineus]
MQLPTPVTSQRLALLAALLGGATAAHAQNFSKTITTAVPILTLSPDSRSAALGEAGVALSPDANAAFYNPGKLGFVPYKYSVSPSYTPWLRSITDDMGLSYLSGYAKVGERSALSASLLYFDLGQIQYRDANNIEGATFNPKEYALTVSYGQKLSENFGLGVSARYIRSNLTGGSIPDARPGNAVAVDVGAYYNKDTSIGTGLYNIAFGATVSNVGNKMTYTDPINASFLPTTLKLGTAITRQIDQYNKITLAFDVSKLLVPSPYYEDNPTNDPTIRNRVAAENRARGQKGPISAVLSSFTDAPGGFKEELQEINLSGGLEYSYNDLLYARAGYFYENPDKGARQYASFGLGVRYQVFGIDGAYLVPNSQANPLAQTIRVSLHFNFNKLAEAFDGDSGGTSGNLPNN